jgi:membrane protein DedA with SNARE-associated domain
MQSFVTHHVESSGYPLLFVLGLLGAMCIPFPSEVTFGVGGALSSSAFDVGHRHAHLSLWAVIVLGTIATTLGASVAYVVGRFGGRGFVDRFGRIVLLTHEDLDRTERLFGRFGDGLVAVGQCIPLLRAFVGFGAGVAKVRPAIFVPLTAVGAAVWVSLIAVIGYEAGNSYQHVTRWFGDAGYVLAALVVLAIVLGVVHRVRHVREVTSRDGG